MIRVPNVRVVDEQGSQLGVLPTGEALRIAQERGYDLVEVAPMAVPPVVRLLDYGQYKYEAAKREKEARRHQRSVDFKEIRLKPKIGSGDFDTKVRRAIQFLEDGDRVKVACTFRGRELTHAYLGRDLLMKFAEQVKEHGVLDRQPLLEGKSMSIVITSTHKPKSSPEGKSPSEPAPQQEPPRRSPASTGAAAAAPAAAAGPDGDTAPTAAAGPDGGSAPTDAAGPEDAAASAGDVGPEEATVSAGGADPEGTAASPAPSGPAKKPAPAASADGSGRVGQRQREQQPMRAGAPPAAAAPAQPRGE